MPAASIESLKLVPDVDAGMLHVTVDGPRRGGGAAVEAVALDGDPRGGPRQRRVAGDSELTLTDLRQRQALVARPSVPLRSEGLARRATARRVDAVDSYFGMRKIALGKDDKGITRLLLNSKFVFQSGPLDQGFWPDGIYTAPTDEALRYDIEVDEEAGLQHGPQARQGRARPLVLLVRQAGPAGLAGHAQRRRRASDEQGKQGKTSVPGDADATACRLGGEGPAVRDRIAGPGRSAPQPSLDHHVGRLQRRLGAVRHAAADRAGSSNSIPRGW